MGAAARTPVERQFTGEPVARDDRGCRRMTMSFG
jgi:hypothetical protein